MEFCMLFVDQLAAGFTMHSAESLADRPHPAADPIARFEDGHPASASLELTCCGKPRQPCTDDNDSHSWHASS
jgi:hypothetical protein